MTWTTGPLLGIDLETTSPLPTEALPVSFALVNFDEGKVTGVRHALVNPGVPIPPEATAIHGITDADVQARGGGLEATAHGLLGSLLMASQSGRPVVGMNIRYDLGVLDALLRRLEGAGLAELGFEGDLIDPLVLDRHCDRFRRGSRKLPNLCETYRVRLDDAHTAAADTVATVQVTLAIAQRYPEVAKAPAHDLYLLQRQWHREWAENYSEYLVNQGKDALPPAELEWPGF